MTRIILLLLTCLGAFAQQARIMGTVQSAVPSLEVKTDKGDILKVALTEKATIRKVAPGAKDLSTAQTVTLDDLASGDRVLLRGAQTGLDFSAESIILMSSREIAQKNQAETAEWTKRGVSGIVDKVDAATGDITIQVRGPEGPKPVKVSTNDKTEVKRYAKDSVKYLSALPSKPAEIKKGDQLRALGIKPEEAGQITAERIIYGTFRSVAGTISSINAETKQVVLKDYQNSKPLTIQLSAETTIKKMPQFGGGMGGGGGQRPAGGPPPGMGGGMAGGMRPGGPGGFDPSQMIERLPAVTFSDLTVGDTIMVASTPTDKPDQLIAITVVGGAEMILSRLAAQGQQAAAAGAARGGASMGGAMGGGGGGLDAIMGMPGIQ